MRGGFVRGGAARLHGPRLSARSEGELLHRSLKKVRKIAEEEEFIGNSTLVARKEDWMEEERSTEGAEADIHVIGVTRANNEENSKRSFAQAVRAGKAQQGESGNEAEKDFQKDKMEEESDEESDEEQEISIEKTENGVYNLVISKSLKKEICKEWWESIIVKLLGRRISLLALKRRLETMWGKNGSIDVIDLGNDFFLVKFYNMEDLDFALMEGPWKILDHYLTIRWWKPEFNPLTATIDTLATWIRLPGLAIEYYNRTILEKIGNIVGRTMKIDMTTENISRGKYARICVEIDLSKPLVSQYQINGITHLVEYEGLHMVCFNCGCFGHEKSSCPSLRSQEKPEASNNNEGKGYEKAGTEEEEGGRIGKGELSKGKGVIAEENNGFGPWMLVQRTRGKKLLKNGEGTSNGQKGKEKVLSYGEHTSRFAALQHEVVEGDKETNEVVVIPQKDESDKTNPVGSKETTEKDKRNKGALERNTITKLKDQIPQENNQTHKNSPKPRQTNSKMQEIQNQTNPTLAPITAQTMRKERTQTKTKTQTQEDTNMNITDKAVHFQENWANNNQTQDSQITEMVEATGIQACDMEEPPDPVPPDFGARNSEDLGEAMEVFEREPAQGEAQEEVPPSLTREDMHDD
ncbi:hypothetical protein AHAS_Ahas19G0020100 [Arachis hypogaea]